MANVKTVDKPPACLDCFFGEVFVPQGEIKKMVRCRFGFATAATIPKPAGIEVRFLRPVWEQDEWCYQWRKRPETPLAS
jgi:hypothetical protein